LKKRENSLPISSSFSVCSTALPMKKREKLTHLLLLQRLLDRFADQDAKGTTKHAQGT